MKPTKASAMMQDAILLRSFTRSAVAVFLVIAGFLLIFEQRAYVPGTYLLSGAQLGLCLLVLGWLHQGLKRLDDRE